MTLVAWVVCQSLLAAGTLGSAAVVVQPLSSLFRCISPVLIFLSILPSDTWAVHAVRGMFLLMVCVHVAVFAVNMEDFLSSLKRGEESDPRWGDSSESSSLLLSSCALVRRLVNVLAFLWTFAYTFSCRTVKVKGWREKELLAHWNRFRFIVFVFSLVDLGMAVAIFVAGNWDAALYNIGLSALPELILSLFMAVSSFRRRIQSWLASSTPAFAAASSIAALLAGHSPQTLYTRAAQQLRCIPLNEVSEQDFTDQTSQPQAVSRTARFGEIDAFVSHSWRDDPELKWRALQEWRAEFKAQCGREPVVWIDKFCIDQSSIEQSLACLPLFLASCRTLLVLCGDAYLERLWCIVELFVFSEAGGSSEAVTVKVFSRDHLPGTDTLDSSIRKRISEFDVQKASCFDPADTARLLEVIQGGCDSTEDFNRMVKNLFVHCIGPIEFTARLSNPEDDFSI